MYFKDQRYQKAKASTLASTHTVELPDTGLLDSMSIYLRVKNAADMSAVTAPCIHRHITKIEVIGDSDKILHSLSGEEEIAKAYRKMRALPPFKQNGYNIKYQDLTIPIFFGRRYKDGHYALDLSKWDKVELQVTNDFTTTEITAASLTMETRLCTIQDPTETYAKFLKQWEYQSDKPDTDADYVRPKLPTTGLLRSLMIQLDPDIAPFIAETEHTDPAGGEYNWKLWFKDRALTIYDHTPRDLMRDEARRLGIGHSSLKIYPQTAYFNDYHWAEVLAITGAQMETAGDLAPVVWQERRERFQKVLTAGGAAIVQAAVQGVGLFHTFEIPFYLPEDIESAYLNLDTYKPIEIEWYGYLDNNTHRIILEKPIGQGPAEFA